MKLSRVLKKLGKLKKESKIENFSVSLTSLEEMFLKMAQGYQQVSNIDVLLEQL